MWSKFSSYLLVLAVTCSTVLTFSGWKISRPSKITVMMGGKSLAESKLTQKGIFKQLRNKLNTAAEIPGFFDVGEGKPVSSVVVRSSLLSEQDLQ